MSLAQLFDIKMLRARNKSKINNKENANTGQKITSNAKKNSEKIQKLPMEFNRISVENSIFMQTQKRKHHVRSAIPKYWKMFSENFPFHFQWKGRNSGSQVERVDYTKKLTPLMGLQSKWFDLPNKYEDLQQTIRYSPLVFALTMNLARPGCGKIKMRPYIRGYIILQFDNLGRYRHQNLRYKIKLIWEQFSGMKTY